MRATLQPIFLCMAAFFVQVRADNSAQDIITSDAEDENRGLFDLFLGQQQVAPHVHPDPLVIPSPAAFLPAVPVIPVAPHTHTAPQVIQVPRPPQTADLPPIPPIPHVHQTTNNHGHLGLRPHRPGFLNQLFAGRRSSEETGALLLNQEWVRHAIQKCAIVNPRSLTAILPTSSNMLREPRIYYFENSTNNAKTWSQAQAWCSKNGMQLATVNNIQENAVLQDLIKKIVDGSAAGGVDSANAFWIGLNRRNGDGTWQYIGDSTPTFVDWHVDATAGNEPTPGGAQCAAMSQRYTQENIHFDAKTCDDAVLKFRYICEVSEPCVALFMSRFRSNFYLPTAQHHNHNHLDTLIGK